MTYLVPGAGISGIEDVIDLKKIAGKAGGKALDWVADEAASTPAVIINRARIAAVVDAGYSAADRYAAIKPGLFVAGLVGALVSGYALSRRRKNPEAVVLYAISSIASLAVAWVSRPDALVGAAPAAAPAAASEPGSKSSGFFKSSINWADGRVALRTATQPGWESATFNRLMRDLGHGTMKPAISTFLTKNSH
jgi:hypothetical protein